MSDGGELVVQKWHAPAVDEGESPVRPNTNEAKSEQDAKREQALQQGYQEGYQQGLSQGQAELEQQIGRLTQLMSCLSRPFEELDGQVEQELVKLSMTIAQNLVRRELRADPKQIMGVVREALKILPVASRDVRLLLHPEDAALVRELFSKPHDGFAWTIVEDPMITRGGCQVTTQTSRIDARIESRIGKIFAEILGGERSQDD